MLWGAGFSWMAALLTIIAVDTKGAVQLLASVGAVASAAFVAYVLAIDVPLYVRRFRSARAVGHRYLSITQGVRDAWERRESDHSWEKWKDDAIWLTPYFSVGVWISMALVFVPLTLSL